MTVVVKLCSNEGKEVRKKKLTSSMALRRGFLGGLGGGRG